MNACIYAVLNLQKCEICRKKSRIFFSPVISDQNSYRNTISEICNKCFENYVVK